MKTEIIKEIEKSKNLYNRLILITGPFGSGKTTLIRNISNDAGQAILNVNLELSKYLLDLSKKQRMLKASNCLSEIINRNYNEGEVVFLDNIEILFDTELKQDPLRLLQALSRHHCIVATWNGIIDGESLIYAKIGHQEYRKYDRKGLITFTMNQIKNE
ncbi:MAG: BREX-3 system P-loop-containing protein BrxF [Euryarchaeota archaeon]|nr:BREX-3 system P-loop-containing protein BrxF [Euryarchaeota archaeon]